MYAIGRMEFIYNSLPVLLHDISLYFWTAVVLLSFDQPVYSITEEDVGVPICIGLNGTLEKAISVTLSTSDDTAEGNWELNLKLIAFYIIIVMNLSKQLTLMTIFLCQRK